MASKLSPLAVELPDRLILVRKEMGLPHRELAADWASMRPGPLTVVCQSPLIPLWQDFAPPDADVLSIARAALHPGLVSRKTAVIDTPLAGSRFTKRYNMILDVARETENVLISISPQGGISQAQTMGVLVASAEIPAIPYPTKGEIT